jgi:hypothetical protein
MEFGHETTKEGPLTADHEKSKYSSLRLNLNFSSLKELIEQLAAFFL